MERELELTRREIKLMRRMQQLNITQPLQAMPHQMTEHPPARITSIIEILAHIDGSSDMFESWENQVRWLKNAYNLSERNTKNLIVARLKGNALHWFHSRSEYIALPCEKLLVQIKAMFHDEKEKAEKRARFKECVWRKDETFKEYFYEKIILASSSAY